MVKSLPEHEPQRVQLAFEDRQVHADRARAAVFDLEPGQAGRLPDRRGVAEAISHEACASSPSWSNRMEAQFTALRYFTLDGTDHASRAERASMIRRYIAWRNRNTDNPRLRKIVQRAAVA
jgi:hypothetical protein